MDFEKLMEKIKEIFNADDSRDKLFAICDLLRDEVIHYDWVGVYLAEDELLVLGPFSGEPTEHVRIPFGKGVCGSAAQKKKTVIVSDVSKESNYLSCGPDVKSEIVIPILDNEGNVMGELDIDSHTQDAFTDEDKKFLEEVSKVIRPLL